MTEDKRYNIPKGEHGISDEAIEKAIIENTIYSAVRNSIYGKFQDTTQSTVYRDVLIEAQKKQVGYGLKKYPETLNKDSWTTIETIDHIIEESVDKLHYLVMLRQKLSEESAQMTIDFEALMKGGE